jgi:hypothetical protein
MKALLFTLLFSQISFANGGRTAIYRYLELVPNQKLVLNISVETRCANVGQEKISIEDFESEKSYPSTETGKAKSVRINTYYIESFSPCSTPIHGKISKQVTIGPFKDKMTHIRITTTENIKIETL